MCCCCCLCAHFIFMQLPYPIKDHKRVWRGVYLFLLCQTRLFVFFFIFQIVHRGIWAGHGIISRIKLKRVFYMLNHPNFPWFIFFMKKNHISNCNEFYKPVSSRIYLSHIIFHTPFSQCSYFFICALSTPLKMDHLYYTYLVYNKLYAALDFSEFVDNSGCRKCFLWQTYPILKSI